MIERFGTFGKDQNLSHWLEAPTDSSRRLTPVLLEE